MINQNQKPTERLWFLEFRENPDPSPSTPQKKNANSKVNATNSTSDKTTTPCELNTSAGATKERRSKSKNAAKRCETIVPVSGPLTAKEACVLLGCHYQTFLYRERKGDIRSFMRIKRMKFYHRHDVLLLAKQKPVKNKPHYTKRTPTVVSQPETAPKQQTAWQWFLTFMNRLCTW